MSNFLHDKLAEGDTVEISAPFGDFFLDSTKSPVVLISAGVGVTPLASMLHTIFESDGPQRPVSWVQVMRSRKAHPLYDEVQRLLKLRPEFVKRAIFYSAPGDDVVGEEYDFKGRMDLDKVDEDILRLADPSANYYVCGPEPFMTDIIQRLKLKGVDAGRLHAEVFGQGAVPL